jgi:hypothetical protein
MTETANSIEIDCEHTFMRAGYYLTLGIIELTDAMLMAKQDKDAIEEVNRKFDSLWEAYNKAAKEGSNDQD